MKHEKNIKLSADRLNGFSDGLIAIIITLMVLELPLPSDMELHSLLEFGKSILIYFASFIVIGAQWNRHHFLMKDIKEVSNSFIWKNLLYLFLLSLIPLFMKWLIQYPDNVIPAISYSIIYLLTSIAFKWLFITDLKNSSKDGITDNVPQFSQPSLKIMIFRMIPIILFGMLLVLAYFLPEIAIIFFIVFPVAMSLTNIFNS